MGNIQSTQLQNFSIAEPQCTNRLVANSFVEVVCTKPDMRPYEIAEWPTKYGAPLHSSLSGPKYPYYRVRRNLAYLMQTLQDTFKALELGPSSHDINCLLASSEWYSNGDLVTVSIDITFSAEPDGGDPEYLIEFKRVQGPRFQASDMAFHIAQRMGLEPPENKSPTAHFFSGPRYTA